MNTVIAILEKAAKISPDTIAILVAGVKIWKEIPDADKLAVENAVKALIKELEDK